MSNLKEVLQQIKDEVALQYDKKDWNDALRDYEYGLGISKLIDFESLMDIVCKRYAEEAIKEASVVAEIKFIDKVETTEHVKFKVVVDKQSILNLIDEL